MIYNSLRSIGCIIAGILLLILNGSFSLAVKAEGNSFREEPPALHPAAVGVVVLNSHGFNARKPSGFSINGVTERVSRGLTIIHYNSPDTYEFKTFDTYSSEAAAVLFFQSLNQLVKDKASFSILAHDSAAKSLGTFTGKLKEMGFQVLSTLGNREAYLMHNLAGGIREGKHELSVTMEVPIPAGIDDSREYFPQVRYEFEPSPDRYIAHAGGEVNGIKSTNTREALDESYRKGFRMMELDIIQTSDGHYVASHDWAMWSRFTGYEGKLPVSREEFVKHPIYGQYTTLTMERINEWFSAHPDATLITDKVNDPVKFAGQFIDKSRLIMELFSFMALEEASLNGITAMISQDQLLSVPGDKLVYLKANQIEYAAVSRRIVPTETKLLEQLRAQGVKVYVYNVNFDPGKDERYVLDHEIGLVYGMYADKWIFDQPAGELRR